MNFYSCLVLTRPANIITAIADILAGVAIAGLTVSQLSHSFIFDLGLLVVSTIGLYGGGIVFNDVFDAEADAKERPERPIPSGKVNVKQATTLGIVLLLIGIISASFVSASSAVIAISIVICALVYDKYAKHYQFFGPLMMGLCRAGNLLLGISIISSSLIIFWPMGFLPLIFIAAITLTSQGETIGNNKLAVFIAFMMDMLVVVILIYLGTKNILNLWTLLPFLGLWMILNFQAKGKAFLHNQPQNIMRAVKMGVISLIPLNASYAAGFGDWIFGLCVLSLLPLSMLLAKKFAVT